jgi:hypothetical protein
MRQYVVMHGDKFLAWDRQYHGSGYPFLTDSPYGKFVDVHKTFDAAKKDIDVVERFGDYQGKPNIKMLKVVGIEYVIVSPFGEVEEF